MKTNILTLVVFAIFISSLVLFIHFTDQVGDFNQIIPSIKNRYYEMKFEGIVSDKYIDKNGGRRTLRIKEFQNNLRLDMSYESYELYEFIEIGDSLIKDSSGVEFYIVSETKDSILKFEFANLREDIDF